MIEQNSIIKLGGKYEYVVVFSTIYNDCNYIFITNIENNADSAFYKVGNDSNLEIVKDDETISKLLELYGKNENI